MQETNQLAQTLAAQLYVRNLWQHWLQVSVSLFLLFTVLLLCYFWQNPQRIYASQAQLFWNSSADGAFQEAEQIRLPVRVDNEYHIYHFVFNSPKTMRQIRLDASEFEAFEQAELYSITLIDEQSGSPFQFKFSADESWQTVNFKELSRTPGHWSLKAKKVDAYWISPSFTAFQIKEVQVEMKLSTPYPFWYWVFRIDI